jgi:lysophospholipase L1-like esterase
MAGLFNRFPFTNFHEVNTDWIIREVKGVGDKLTSLDDKITADMLALAKQITGIQQDVNTRLDGIEATIAAKAAEEVQKLVEEGRFDELITPALDQLSKDLQDDIALATHNAQEAREVVNKTRYLNRLENKSILIIGDSNSDENYTSSAGTLTTHWTTEFKNLITSKAPANGTTITNNSKSGSRMVYAKEQLTTINATKTWYDIILIMLGTNDYGHATPIADFRTTLGEIATLLQPHITARQTEVYIVSPPKRTLANRDKADHVPLVAYARELYNWATKNGFNFIDCWGKMPELNVTSDSSRKQWLIDSSLHFSNAYAPIFANWILGYLAENKSDTIGDYFEEYRGACMTDWFSNINNFTYDPAQSYIKVGTRSAVVRIAGKLKQGGGNTSGLQPLGHIPDWLIGVNGVTFLNAVWSSFARHGATETTVAFVNNGNKLLYADITGNTTSGKTYYIQGVIPILSNQPYDE